MLCKNSNYVVTYTNSFCVIQDRTSRNLIGVGSVNGWVFLHKEVPNLKFQAKTVITYDLWH